MISVFIFSLPAHGQRLITGPYLINSIQATKLSGSVHQGGFLRLKEINMQKIKVTMSGLEACSSGVKSGATVNFKVYRDGDVIITDSVTGKVSEPYTRSYEVKAGSGALRVEHDRCDLPRLNISAAFTPEKAE